MDAWRSRGGYWDYWSHITQTDFLALLSAILLREVADVESVFSYIEQRELLTIQPIEEEWRAARAIEKEEASRKKMEEEARRIQEQTAQVAADPGVSVKTSTESESQPNSN